MIGHEALPLVILTHPIPEAWIGALKSRCRLLTGPATIPGFSEELLIHLNHAQGLITLLMDKVDESLLQRAPNLKVVANYAAGYDNIDLSACTSKSIPVGNTPGVLTNATADLTFALILATSRGMLGASQDAREGRWGIWQPDGWLGLDLQGAVLGILGMGNIGRAVARRAFGFGLKIIYADPVLQPVIDHDLGARRVNMEELFTQSDFLSIHCQLTPQTRGMVDSNALRQMKQTSILINTARGDIVDTEALVDALSRGTIRAAGLDVTAPEPLPPNHALYKLPNCVILPHIGSATEYTRRKMAEITCDNILAGLDGRHLPYCVNPEVYQLQDLPG